MVLVWTYGITQPERHKCVLPVAAGRTAATLLALIQKHAPVTTHGFAVSIGMASYRQMRALWCQPSVVIHHEELAKSEGFLTNIW